MDGGDGDRYTAEDSQKSVMRFHDCVEDYTNNYNQMVKVNSSVPPMISIIGTLYSPPEHIYVDYDNIRYKVGSFIKGIEICFKLFFVFGIEFPPQSAAFWEFLDAYFFKIQPDSNRKINKSVIKLIESLQSITYFYLYYSLAYTF